MAPRKRTRRNKAPRPKSIKTPRKTPLPARITTTIPSQTSNNPPSPLPLRSPKALSSSSATLYIDAALSTLSPSFIGQNASMLYDRLQPQLSRHPPAIIRAAALSIVLRAECARAVALEVGQLPNMVRVARRRILAGGMDGRFEEDREWSGGGLWVGGGSAVEGDEGDAEAGGEEDERLGRGGDGASENSHDLSSDENDDENIDDDTTNAAASQPLPTQSALLTHCKTILALECAIATQDALAIDAEIEAAALRDVRDRMCAQARFMHRSLDVPLAGTPTRAREPTEVPAAPRPNRVAKRRPTADPPSPSPAPRRARKAGLKVMQR